MILTHPLLCPQAATVAAEDKISKIERTNTMSNSIDSTETKPAFDSTKEKWYDRLCLVYSKNNSTPADVMPPQTIPFLVPTHPIDAEHTTSESRKLVAQLNVSLTVDDWGTLEILDSAGTSKLRISMTSQDATPGVQGGHAKWTKTAAVNLESGVYVIKVNHMNIDYNPQVSNLSYCKVDITSSLNMKYPKRYDVIFNERSTDGVIFSQMNDETSSNTICPSGYVFKGIGTVTYNDSTTMTFPVQSGGWMSRVSPFNKPSEDDVNASFPAKKWPDTCCPSAVSAIHTGSNPSGYLIDVDPATNRSGIRMHIAKRIGSEGCISVLNPNVDETIAENKWPLIVSGMQKASAVYPYDALEMSVVYNVPALELPNPNRYL